MKCGPDGRNFLDIDKQLPIPSMVISILNNRSGSAHVQGPLTAVWTVAPLLGNSPVRLESEMLPYMPFLTQYWPFIVAGLACFVAGRYLFTVLNDQTEELTPPPRPTGELTGRSYFHLEQSGRGADTSIATHR
ncbi:hypothetical protein J6590_079394 [Homalodisca vitripennis]|nr:hypothetical protein J6590_079394 [Homalodisca vitripennis]